MQEVEIPLYTVKIVSVKNPWNLHAGEGINIK